MLDHSLLRNAELEFVFGDFETFYSKDYTLRDLDPPSYILDQRFAAHCLGVCDGLVAPPIVLDADNIQGWVDSLRERNVAFVSHNALFDACILAWHFNYVPDLIVDTLGMSRTLLGHLLKSLSLRSVGSHFGLTKGDTVLKVQGMSAADIKFNGWWPEYTSYCAQDTAICRAIFTQLAPLLPPEEFILHDMILRCAVEPQFRIDQNVLAQHLSQVQVNKQNMFAKAMLAGLEGIDELMSNDKFAAILRSLNVKPPVKISKTTGRLTYAFAKTDKQFLALLEHEDPRVQVVCQARLDHKTTIEETRTQRMINIGNLTFGSKGDGWMPIPLKIGAAHTHRLGGDWKLNPQNWGRKSPIRKAVVAPEGHKVLAADSAQIEARMNAWFCGQWDLVEQFAKGEDVYSNFASLIFGVPVSKKSEPAKRFVGKTGILQLGYQSGWEKFKSTVWLLSYQDPDMDLPIDLSDSEAQSIVLGYRSRYYAIQNMWDRLREMIPFVAGAPIDNSASIGPITFARNRIIGPNGLIMNYHDLRYYPIDGWTHLYGEARHKLYGGKFLENIIQFLARVAVMQAAIRLRKPLLPYDCRLTHTAHDEIVYIVPDQYVSVVSPMVRNEMCRTPDWAPGLPLACDVGVGQSYGDCK